MIIITKESGFCAGVRNAVKHTLGLEQSISGDKKIYLYGDLVNNTYVMQDFCKRGFITVDDVKEIPHNAIVIIRAHGASQSVYSELNKKNVTIHDCTCVKVTKIHELVQEKSHTGFKVFVVGCASHPEVIGTVGWCAEGGATVIDNESFLRELDFSGKACVVAQTTASRKLWEHVISHIRKMNPDAEIYDTVCNVTGNREAAAMEVAASCDLMIIIGDEKSSNSKELYNVCKNISNTLFIGSLADILDSKLVHSAENIGLAASASAPDCIIADVYNYLMFIDYLKNAKDRINESIPVLINKFRGGIPNNPIIRGALESLSYQNEGGKRIRGAMILLGEKIAKSQSDRTALSEDAECEKEESLPIAVGYELFQTSILIHDDIIDKGTTRRNKPTIHTETAKRLGSMTGKCSNDAEHIGMARALCVGDYGFFIAYQFLAECDIDADLKIKVYKLYSEILAKTCEGELMDVLLPVEGIGGNTAISDQRHYAGYQQAIMQIYEYKTAWYTLAGPIMLGAVCGGGDEKLVSLLRDIMLPLGIAFQIKDDLLDIYSETLEKTALSDIRENKQTLMLCCAYSNANDEQRLLLDEHYGKADANEDTLQIIRRVFEDTGAKEYAENELLRLSERSMSLIDNPMLDKDSRAILQGCAGYLTRRLS